jgi:hypothetical protein
LKTSRETALKRLSKTLFQCYFFNWLGSDSYRCRTSQHDAKQDNKHRQIVNRSVSFNAIKNKAFDLLNSNMATAPLLEQLTALFMTSPTLERKGRSFERKKTSASKKLDFYKRRKKHCF